MNSRADVIVVEDRVDAQCVRHVHLMSNAPLSASTLTSPQMRCANLGGEWLKEAGVWHYRAEYPYRGVLDVACINGGQNFRRLVVWSLDGKGVEAPNAPDAPKMTIRGALREAAVEFERLFGSAPRFAFMRRLPQGVEIDQEVGKMVLLEAEWMLERAVAVGCKA